MRVPILMPLLAGLALTVQAADPADPQAKVPPLPHRTALSRPAAALAEPADPARWRAAHEAMQRAGGWRAYAREPLPAASAAPAQRGSAR